ncbi:MAG: hypothetical protein ABIP97_14360 [Chthoniobacterales bacterium]
MRLLSGISLLLSLLAPTCVFAGPPINPDTIVLKDGTVINGLIVLNTRNSVTIQEKYNEHTFPKSQIARIRDDADLSAYFTDIERKGNLPPWRMIANDLRNDDSVKHLEEIPAAVIDNGEFKNTPYMSFRVNSNVELEIYGNPDDPAGIEIGVYGSNSDTKRLKKICREFIASYLTTRKELAALYALDLYGKKGESINAEEMTLKTTMPDAPDGYGAWWIAVYNKKAIQRERLSDAQYARLTTPLSEIMNNKGELHPDAWNRFEGKESHRITSAHRKNMQIYARGFYRDSDGVFHIIPAHEKISQ